MATSLDSTADGSNSPNSSTETKRVNVIFSQDQYAALQRLAASQGINLSDALRQAINVSELIVNANADKDTQILIKKGDSVQELKIVR
jgi:Ribbon-helix-helix protein, copG family